MSFRQSLPRTMIRTRHFHPTPLASSSGTRHYASRSSFTRPGPPPLPAADQAEFEAQQKAAQTVGATPASTLPPGEVSKEVDVDLEKHRDLRRGPIPEFMGDRNPKTGETGGPKVDPFKSGDGDWSYAGRVTVSRLDQSYINDLPLINSRISNSFPTEIFLKPHHTRANRIWAGSGEL